MRRRCDRRPFLPGAALAVFPIMIVMVAAAGIALTALTDGRRGLRELRSLLVHWPADRRWWLLVVLQPASVLGVLTILHFMVSPAFAGVLLIGIAFGAVADFFEEIGWTGSAYPRLRGGLGPLVGHDLVAPGALDRAAASHSRERPGRGAGSSLAAVPCESSTRRAPARRSHSSRNPTA